MKLRIVMADPAGNRTAIVRTQVSADRRAGIAAALLSREDLRAEQVGFETAPVMGAAGRLEMMGGEFCGNAARSYGYLIWLEKNEKAGRQEAESKYGKAERQEAKSSESDSAVDNSESDDAICGSPSGRSSGCGAGNIRIEISGSPRPLEVRCDAGCGSAFADMPMPLRLEHSPEGYPMVVSEGITHMILEETEPDQALAARMIDRYGDSADAFGIMFLEGDRLTPFVYVAAAGSRVWESSCGSGSLAAAWYLWKKPQEGSGSQEAGQPEEAQSCRFRFREPGGELIVEIQQTEDSREAGRMGGAVTLEEEKDLEL